MVSKFLLAAQESFLRAVDQNEDATIIKELADVYYDIGSGIGFNKSPEIYGAFPTDPYSHTPAHQGARQPGMTGQVKEEILTRLVEMGMFVHEGKLIFNPYTFCQIPIGYISSPLRKIVVVFSDGRCLEVEGNCLDTEASRHIFQRDGHIKRIIVYTEAGL